MSDTTSPIPDEGDAPNLVFLNYLFEGGKHLSAGEYDSARELLEKALDLQPRSWKVRNLLGLTCFKSGAFERSGEVYDSLVRENPSDPTLRINLGLAYLKQESYDRAIVELQEATALAPDSEKAQQYLRHALAMLPPVPSPSPGEALDAGSPESSEGAGNGDDLGPHTIEQAQRLERLWDSLDLEPAWINEVFEPQEQREPDAPVEPVRAAVEPEPAHSSPPGTVIPPPSAFSLFPAELGVPLDAMIDGPFAITPEQLTLCVEGELRTRLSGLVAAQGSLTFQPELKRYRGQATDKLFGDGERRMIRVAGMGMVFLSSRGKHFAVLPLGDESVYLREECLFGFESTVTFENGRVPGEGLPDLHLVFLKGPGRLLLAVASEPGCITLQKESGSLIVPYAGLIGWSGSLVPKLIGLPPDPERGTLSAVELSGEGQVLISR